jgi:DNA-binding response OmpR family regulator
VILVTAYGSIPLTVEAMRAGADNCLAKPIRAVSFMTAIRTALGRSAPVIHRMHVRLNPLEHQQLTGYAESAGLTQTAALRRLLRQSMLDDRPPFQSIQDVPDATPHHAMHDSSDRVQVRFDATEHEAQFLARTAEYCGMSVNSVLRVLVRRAAR